MGNIGVGSETVTQEAERIVGGDRRKDYGHPYDSCLVIANLWNALFSKYLKEGSGFKPEDISQAMVCFKLARQQNAHKRDNLVDICGYARLTEMIEDYKLEVVSPAPADWTTGGDPVTALTGYYEGFRKTHWASLDKLGAVEAIQTNQEEKIQEELQLRGKFERAEPYGVPGKVFIPQETYESKSRA